MTEQEWLQATDPQKMLDFLARRGSDRKLRLFCCAGCLRIFHLLTDDPSRKAVEIAEKYADGSASSEELQASWDAAWEVGEDRASGAINPHDPALRAAWAAVGAAEVCDPWWGVSADLAEAVASDEELVTQAKTLRDIFGPLPFRTITLNPYWLTWHDGLLASMAQKMYDSRDFSDMPVLADALEEAGCTNQDILGHCQSGGEHVRGCWVVDLVLGKS